MLEINQRQDYVASEKIKPEIFNQIGRNINDIVDEVNKKTSYRVYAVGKEYSSNDVIKNDDTVYIVKNNFTATNITTDLVNLEVLATNTPRITFGDTVPTSLETGNIYMVYE